MAQANQARPQPMIAGNWKMNGRRRQAAALGRDLARRATGSTARHCAIVICPPAPLLLTVADAIAGAPIALGAQDCHGASDGAHTGDVSAAMLADVGCRYVIIGHSERRTEHAETDAVVKTKAAAAQSANLIAIICVGETEGERIGGATLEVVARQLRESLPAGATAANTVIAYEPMWAIGTGRTPTKGDVAEVHAHLRDRLAALMADAGAVRLLYGGSVKAANAAELLAIPGVDGALVGGASLNADEFWRIIESCP